jgi:LCP family protein required for cell wall assembly
MAKAKSKSTPKKKNKMPLALKFIVIVFGMVFTFVTAVLAGGWVYLANNNIVPLKAPPNPYGYEDASASRSGGITFLSAVPQYTNFVIAGVDDEGDGVNRTDTIMLGSFNSETNNLSIISIPRDIQVSMPADLIRQLNHAGRYPPSYMKFCEIHAYAGKDYGMYSLVRTIEHLFDIKIDYYVKVDLDAFVEVVNVLGGVEMTLDRNYYYRDPTQNLTINLKAGHQLLMGEQALGLVRYRATYRDGDLGRIKVQQRFMNELFKQALTRDNILKNLPQVLQVIVRNVETDITVAQATKYLKFVPRFTPDNLHIYTIPAPAENGFRDDTGKSFLRMNQAGAAEIIDEVFRGKTNAPPENSIGLPISVLNGSGVSGLAATTRENLENLGYRVSSVGDFTGTRRVNDRIFVKKRGFAEDLKFLFNDTEIIVDESMVSRGAEITVVLGTGHRGN